MGGGEMKKQCDWQLKKKQQGLCIICGKRKIYKSWRCKNCYAPFKIRSKEFYHRRIKGA